MRISDKDCGRYLAALAEIRAWTGGFAAARPDCQLPAALQTLAELEARLVKVAKGLETSEILTRTQTSTEYEEVNT